MNLPFNVQRGLRMSLILSQPISELSEYGGHMQGAVESAERRDGAKPGCHKGPGTRGRKGSRSSPVPCPQALQLTAAALALGPSLLAHRPLGWDVGFSFPEEEQESQCWPEQTQSLRSRSNVAVQQVGDPIGWGQARGRQSPTRAHAYTHTDVRSIHLACWARINYEPCAGPSP